MGLIRWIAAKLGRQPSATEHAGPEPSPVASTIPSDEGAQEAARATVAKPQPGRDVEKLQKELDRYLADCDFGGLTSVLGFRDLIDFLLRLTVMQPGTPATCLTIDFERGPNPNRIKGRVPLNDGNFLVVVFSVTARESERLTVWRTKVQYEEGPGKDDWVWRYDYHGPGDRIKPHFNRNEVWWARHKGLRVPHLTPCERRSMERLIRLLVDHQDFRVPCNEDREVWDPLLKRSERWFVLARSN